MPNMRVLWPRHDLRIRAGQVKLSQHGVRGASLSGQREDKHADCQKCFNFGLQYRNQRSGPHLSLCVVA